MDFHIKVVSDFSALSLSLWEENLKLSHTETSNKRNVKYNASFSVIFDDRTKNNQLESSYP